MSQPVPITHCKTAHKIYNMLPSASSKNFSTMFHPGATDLPLFQSCIGTDFANGQARAVCSTVSSVQSLPWHPPEIAGSGNCEILWICCLCKISQHKSNTNPNQLFTADSTQMADFDVASSSRLKRVFRLADDRSTLHRSLPENRGRKRQTMSRLKSPQILG